MLIPRTEFDSLDREGCRFARIKVISDQAIVFMEDEILKAIQIRENSHPPITAIVQGSFRILQDRQLGQPCVDLDQRQ